MQQCVAHRTADVDGDVALRFGSGGTDVRREDDVRHLANRVIGGERLRLIDVEHGTAEVAAL